MLTDDCERKGANAVCMDLGSDKMTGAAAMLLDHEENIKRRAEPLILTSLSHLIMSENIYKIC